MEQEQDIRLESFLKWASDLGISDSSGSFPCVCLGHSVSLAYFPLAGGRGLGAVRDLRKGELILRVPKSALMTRESLLKDEKLFVAVSRHPSLSSTQILTVCLLYEMGKGKSSWWLPYLMHLPRSYDILATFGEFEKQALQVSDAIWAAERAISKARSERNEANQLMAELNLKPQLQTFRAWCWAAATISSRTLHIPWDEAGCLCPVGDLFNYAAPGEETFCSEEVDNLLCASSFQVTSLRLTDGGYEEDVAAYCFYARQNYFKGEQVLLCYGTYTNLELLEHYGFLLNENPNDKVFIPLEPEIYSSCSWPKELLYIHHNGKPSFSLLSALRLWTTPPSKRRSLGQLAYSGSPLSTDNEIHVMKWIANKCNVVLKNLPTSIEEDSLVLSSINEIQDLRTLVELEKAISASRGEMQSFLEANKLQNVASGNNLLLSSKARRSMERLKLAVQWRARYKKILLDCISNCTETIDSLTCGNYLPLKLNKA